MLCSGLAGLQHSSLETGGPFLGWGPTGAQQRPPACREESQTWGSLLPHSPQKPGPCSPEVQTLPSAQVMPACPRGSAASQATGIGGKKQVRGLGAAPESPALPAPAPAPRTHLKPPAPCARSPAAVCACAGFKPAPPPRGASPLPFPDAPRVLRLAGSLFLDLFCFVLFWFWFLKKVPANEPSPGGELVLGVPPGLDSAAGTLSKQTKTGQEIEISLAAPWSSLTKFLLTAAEMLKVLT